MDRADAADGAAIIASVSARHTIDPLTAADGFLHRLERLGRDAPRCMESVALRRYTTTPACHVGQMRCHITSDGS
jgi:hypothetical protein